MSLQIACDSKDCDKVAPVELAEALTGPKGAGWTVFMKAGEPTRPYHLCPDHGEERLLKVRT